MLEIKTVKKGNWNPSNIFFTFQKSKNLPFEGISLGSDSLIAKSKDGSIKLEICNIVSSDESSEFVMRISAPNKKIEKNLSKEIVKLFKPAKFTEVVPDALAKLKQDFRKVLAANGFIVKDEFQEDFTWKLFTENNITVRIDIEGELENAD